jgi:hypothetical protein
MEASDYKPEYQLWEEEQENKLHAQIKKPARIEIKPLEPAPSKTR